MAPTLRTVAVLGASGRLGRRIASRLVRDGHAVRCQTRDAAKLADLDGRATVVEMSPRDRRALSDLIAGADAVVFALGVDRIAETTLFSDVTRTLIEVMTAHGVERLIAVTGVGAGETRGHGGWLYNRLIFPFITRPIYRDKNRQEHLIIASALSWTIVRPAPFSTTPGRGPLEAHISVSPTLQLSSVGLDELAAFICDALASGAYVRQAPFVGRR